MEVRLRNFRCFKDSKSLKLKKLTFLVGENSTGKTSFLTGVNFLSQLCSGRIADFITPTFNRGTFYDIMHSVDSNSIEKNARFACELTVDGSQHIYEFVNDNHRVNFGRIYWTRSSDVDEVSLDFDVPEKTVSITASVSKNEIEALKRFGATVRAVGPRAGDLHVIRFNNVDAPFENNRDFDLGDLDTVIFLNIVSSVNKFPKKRNDYDDTGMVGAFESSKTTGISQFWTRIADFLNAEIKQCIRQNVAFSPLRSLPRKYYSFDSAGTASFDPSGANFPMLFEGLYHADGVKFMSVKRKIERFGVQSGMFNKIEIKRLQGTTDYLISLMVESISGKRNNLVNAGYGVSQILPLIYELAAVEAPTLFLIQHPELHIHPRAQAEFASLIPPMVKNDCEFIIETHSDFIVDRIKHEIDSGRISNEDVGILFFDTTETGMEIHQVNLDDEGLPHDPPESYRRFHLDEFDRVWP